MVKVLPVPALASRTVTPGAGSGPQTSKSTTGCGSGSSVTGPAPPRRPADRSTAAAAYRPKRVDSPAAQPSPDSPGSGGAAEQIDQGDDSAEDELVLGIPVLTHAEVVLRFPQAGAGLLPLGGRVVGPGGGCLAIQGKWLAQAPVVEVDEHPEVGERRRPPGRRIAGQRPEAGDAHRALLAPAVAEPADRGRLHRMVGMGGGQGQEPHPRRQPLLGRQAGVAHRPQ